MRKTHRSRPQTVRPLLSAPTQQPPGAVHLHRLRSRTSAEARHDVRGCIVVVIVAPDPSSNQDQYTITGEADKRPRRLSAMGLYEKPSHDPKKANMQTLKIAQSLERGTTAGAVFAHRRIKAQEAIFSTPKYWNRGNGIPSGPSLSEGPAR